MAGSNKLSPRTLEHLELNAIYGAHNYAPLDVIIARGKGSWVWDVDNVQYLDMMAAYSALNFGHSHPEFIAVAKEQLDKITLTSRAFYNDQLGGFCKELAEFARLDQVLPMNSGAEAVETAIKAARRWGYEAKGVPEDQAEIICFEGNFSGRTISLVSFSSTPEYRKHFGPFTPGFRVVPFGNLEAVETALSKNTVGILIEPIQGEGGIIIPPEGFLKQLRELCDREHIALIADEVQTGFFRTGKRFACDHENVRPDLMVVGKSLGGGIVPVSAVIGTKAIMGLFTPGSHGSTFGGNPFACAIARSVIAFMNREPLEQWSTERGQILKEELFKDGVPGCVSGLRLRGLMVGIDIDPRYGPAKNICHALKERRVLTKDTRARTIRLTPAVTISLDDLRYGAEVIRRVLHEAKLL